MLPKPVAAAGTEDTGSGALTTRASGRCGATVTVTVALARSPRSSEMEETKVSVPV
jgi:hypothetical protein